MTRCKEHLYTRREQLPLPMDWPDAQPPYVPPHGVILAKGGYARAVRCASEHFGRGFLYVSGSSDALWECGNCGRRYASSTVRELQQGELLLAMGGR